MQMVLDKGSIVETKLSLISEDGLIVDTEPLCLEMTDVDSRLDDLNLALDDANQRCAEQDELLAAEREQVMALQEELRIKEASPSEEVRILESKLNAEREKAKHLWRLSCEQVIMHDTMMSEKDTENERLKNS